MTIRRLLCVALLGLAASPALIAPSWAQERCTAEPVTSLPIVLLFGKVLVPVQVDGQPVLFAVDTGGYASAVSETLAARLKLKTGVIRSRVKLTDLGGEVADKYAVIDQLAVGNQLVKAEHYMVAELGPGVDGFLSPDLLRNFDLDFDFAANRLDLYRPRACAGKPPGSNPFSAVAMESTRNGHIRIPVYLDGKRVTALLDTGASETYITDDAARSSFGVSMGAERGIARGASGGTLEFSPHIFELLQIGETAEYKPRLLVADAKRTFDRAAILLGMRHLHSLRLFVSYGEDKLYLSKTTPGR